MLIRDFLNLRFRMLASSTTLVDTDWCSSQEGKQHLTSCKATPSGSPPFNQSCGFFERPPFLLSPPTCNKGRGDSGMLPKVMKFKILVCSPHGNVGKTSLIAKLCGLQPPRKHWETPGLLGYLRYWPIRLKSSGEIVYFQITFYEYGPSAEKNHPNVVRLALDSCDAMIIVFSLSNRNSFEMIPSFVSSMREKFLNVCPSDLTPDVLIMATHSDAVQQMEVSQSDLNCLKKDFPVHKMKCCNTTANVPSIALPTSEDESKKTLDTEVVAFMNNLCSALLLRDKSALQL